MDSQRQPAEKKSGEGRELAAAEPASVLREALPLLPRGTALDLATGCGINAVFLAEAGWRVIAVDVSSKALECASRLAQERGISAVKIAATTRGSFPLAHKQLTLVQMDLETATLPVARFDVILCFRYLQRSLFPALGRALRPGGMLIYQTYTLDHLQFGKHPQNPDYLLRPGELRQAIPLLQPLFYGELLAGKGIATLIALRKRE